MLKEEIMERKPQRVTDIWTHPQPHVDEIVALFILQKYGEKLFPGITNARIQFNRADGDANGTQEDGDKLLDMGVLLLGTGQGMFDDKSPKGVKRNQCCTTLVAKYLGVRDNPELRQLIEYTLNNDRDGASTPCDLNNIIRALYFKYGDDQLSAVSSALDLVEALWKVQYDFHVNGSKAFANADRPTFMRNGKEMKVAILMTDNLQAAKYALYKGADIVVKRDFHGHIQILVNNRTLGGVSLENVVRILRSEEQRATKPDQPVTDWQQLGMEGMLLNWYYQCEGNFQSILNGSKTAPNVTPSLLHSDEIFSAIVAGLTDGWQEYKRQFSC